MGSWICSTCAQSHEGVATGYSYEAPWTWYTVAEEEREQRCFLNADYCVIDNEDFFVRGCLEIPIIGHEEPLIWGVWVSLSKSNFEREQSLADNPERIKEPPYFGWLSSRIEIYPDTAALKTHVHTRQVGTRPFIQLEATDHSCSHEQRTGIAAERLTEIAEQIHHGWKHPQSGTNPY
jgi:hypothetical protein